MPKQKETTARALAAPIQNLTSAFHKKRGDRAARLAYRSIFLFDAFSSREPVSTSLENALFVLTRFLHANRCPLRLKTLF
jgi:hypothetical protein